MNPGAAPTPSLLKKRGFIYLRRRSDKVIFATTCGMLLFSTSVFTYKLKFEAPPVIVKEIGAPALASEPAAPAVQPAAVEVSPAPQPVEEPAFVPEAEVEPAPKKAEKKSAKKEEKKAAKKEAAPPKKEERAEKKAKPGKSQPLFDPAGVKIWKDQDATATLSTAEPSVVDLNYALGAGRWVQVLQDVNGDISGFGGIFFRVMGDGSDCKLELKVEDKDGSMFWTFWNTGLAQKNWSAKKVPFGSLKYMAGGKDKKLDLTQIKRIYVAISGAPGVAGKVRFGEFRLE